MEIKGAHPALPDLGKGKTQDGGSGSAVLLKRSIALTISAVLAALILTSVLPPLVADQSDRAVVNAPVMLLTAPINGEVKTLAAEVGSKVQAHAPMAEVVNDRVDRSTLITLDSQRADSTARLEATRAKRDSDLRYIAMLTTDIARQAATVEARYTQQLADLQAQIGSAGASVEEKRQIVSRENDMVRRNVAAPDMVKAASQQYAAAGYQRVSALAKLAQKQAQLDSVRHGVFVGDDVHDIATLIQKKRDMELDVERLGIEASQIASEAEVRTRLFANESLRLGMLARSSVNAPHGGEVLSVGASLGRHVTAGDTLARMVDCDASFVVAIFSYRQGSDLAPGTRVSIDAGGSGTQEGTVSEVLPKTSDKVDETFAVPFPQTERRELYVLVKPDAPLRTPAADHAAGTCDVGRWVTVSRSAGWIPSSSVLWRHASHAVSSSFAELFGWDHATAAEAKPRRSE